MQYFPSLNKVYKDKTYWDNRFETEEEYDWCKPYSFFRHLIHKNIKLNEKILIIGCGNSSLGPDMYKEGYHDITNTDISPVVIEKMKKKFSSMNMMKWQVMDMMEMKEFPNEHFDVVIEKGTLDVLEVENMDFWNPPKDVFEKMHQTLSEIYRVLKKDGKFISITFAQPHFRKIYYKHFSWGCNVETFGDEDDKSAIKYYFYVLQKGEKMKIENEENWNWKFDDVIEVDQFDRALLNFGDDIF